MTKEERIKDRLASRGLLDHVFRIAREHHVTTEDVIGNRRHKATVAARHAVWLFLVNLGLSWPQVAELFERRHDNIVYAGRRRRRVRDQKVLDAIASIRSAVMEVAVSQAEAEHVLVEILELEKILFAKTGVGYSPPHAEDASPASDRSPV